MEIREEIREYIIYNSLNGFSDGDLDYDDSFLEKGIIDSTGVLELISFVEDKYCINVEDEELIPDNFDSVNRLAAYITSKSSNENIL